MIAVARAHGVLSRGEALTATPRKPSQRDIARIVGVSQAEVSMVLNGKPDAYIDLGDLGDVAGEPIPGGFFIRIDQFWPTADDDYA